MFVTVAPILPQPPDDLRGSRSPGAFRVSRGFPFFGTGVL